MTASDVNWAYLGSISVACNRFIPAFEMFKYTEYFEQREDAEQALIKRRDMQLKRGYRIVFREGELRQG